MKSRKTNRAKRVSSGCRNNGSCGVCRGNRLYSSLRELQADIPEPGIDDVSAESDGHLVAADGFCECHPATPSTGEFQA